MEYDLGVDGSLTPLPKQNVGLGLGLERGSDAPAERRVDLRPEPQEEIMEWVAEEQRLELRREQPNREAHRVIADHGRAMTFLVAAEIVPSNEARGIAAPGDPARRQARPPHRARRGLAGHAHRHRADAAVVPRAAGTTPRRSSIVRAEEGRFSETLERGLSCSRPSRRATASPAGTPSAPRHLRLPLELTAGPSRGARPRGRRRRVQGLMEEQRTRSRAAEQRPASRSALLLEGPKSEFVGYESRLRRPDRDRRRTPTAATARLDAKLEKSPFYPEGGGQVSDVGLPRPRRRVRAPSS